MHTKRFTQVSPIRGTYYSHRKKIRITEKDIFDVVIELNKPAQKLFKTIKSTYQYKYNTCHYTKKEDEVDTSKGPYKTLMKNINTLERSNLLKRLPKNLFRDLRVEEYQDFYFVVNPYHIIPTEYQLVTNVWQQITDEPIEKLITDIVSTENVIPI